MPDRSHLHRAEERIDVVEIADVITLDAIWQYDTICACMQCIIMHTNYIYRISYINISNPQDFHRIYMFNARPCQVILRSVLLQVPGQSLSLDSSWWAKAKWNQHRAPTLPDSHRKSHFRTSFLIEVFHLCSQKHGTDVTRSKLAKTKRCFKAVVDNTKYATWRDCSLRYGSLSWMPLRSSWISESDETPNITQLQKDTPQLSLSNLFSCTYLFCLTSTWTWWSIWVHQVYSPPTTLVPKCVASLHPVFSPKYTHKV